MRIVGCITCLILAITASIIIAQIIAEAMNADRTWAVWAGWAVGGFAQPVLNRIWAAMRLREA